ncbi:MAG: CPXCG motif-containing cysteine-rich protein [Verrucomicrobiae bacterium]|nr:CPXCG motif-containing cysteine-rich protein [Verrucomicrobiae bacterium]MCP5524619.1 CPXCG motif-containing cysteine-rich protein [Verrucomicrobiales bacterium]
MDIEVTESIRCPFCGHGTEISIDTTAPTDDLTIDCEQCCRPFEVEIECAPGRVVRVSVEPG